MSPTLTDLRSGSPRGNALIAHVVLQVGNMGMQSLDNSHTGNREARLALSPVHLSSCPGDGSDSLELQLLGAPVLADILSKKSRSSYMMICDEGQISPDHCVTRWGWQSLWI